MDAASQPFQFVFDAEFFFFHGRHPDFVPIGVGHLGFYELFKASVFVGEFRDMPLQCHQSHLVANRRRN